jgi:Mn-dependent DtxR family transcriptional regulator
MKNADLLDRIRIVIQTSKDDYVTKEDLCARFGATQAEVEQCLHRLNLEGLVSQAHHRGPPFDVREDGTIKTRRADFVQTHQDRWTPDRYSRRAGPHRQDGSH